MAKPTDVKGLPGEFVMPRGQSTMIHSVPDNYDTISDVAKAGRLGLILSTAGGPWTYVLWSDPTVVGWSYDGALRRLGQRG